MDALKVYEEISKLTGFSAKELCGKSLVLVRDRDNQNFCDMGVLENCVSGLKSIDYFVKFANSEKPEKISCNWRTEDMTQGLYVSMNPEMILKEKFKLN
ncbi:MAG: hypothetical protein WC438_02270 [Candidatus Pacearchaeota archaeon]